MQRSWRTWALIVGLLTAGGLAACAEAETSGEKTPRMMADHHRLRVQGVALARKLDVMRQPPPDDPISARAHQQMDALESAEQGRVFDRTYMEQEIEAHQALLELTEQCLRSVGNPELRGMIEETRPLVRAHLEQAQRILDALGESG